MVLFRGHVQTIFGKINGGVACDANFFVCVLLSLLTITPRFCCTGHFIAELTLYQMLESVKDTSLTTVAMSHNKQLIDTVREGV